MQTASGTLTAALQSKERVLEKTVRADWRRDGTFFLDPGIFDDVFTDTFVGAADIGDLSRFVESVDVSRSLSTDLPEASKSDTGFAAADATIVLAGSVSGVPMAQVFGAFDNPLTFLAPRIGAPVTIDFGCRGTAGVEVLRQFTGKARGCSVDPQSGNVTVTCLDSRERFRTPVALPGVVADDFGTIRPNLNAQWMLDYIARQQGFYTSPPMRSQCILSATLHGSAQPEFGTLAYATGKNFLGTVLQRAAQFFPHVDGLLGLSATPTLGQSEVHYTPSASPTINNGDTLFFEYDHITFPTHGNSVNPIFHLSSSVTAGWSVDVNADTANHFLRFLVTRNGAVNTVVSIAFAGLTQALTDHYLGVQITFTATGFVAQAKVDGTTGTVTGVVANSTGSPALNLVTLVFTGDDNIASGLQVTTEPYASTMFNDAFVPTAIFETSLNELTATPTVDTSDPWELCQQIASAEQGIFGFDESGALRFYNRNHMSGGSAVATVTSSSSVGFANLKQAASDEQVDGVANYVTVPATPLALDPPSTAIWIGSEVLGVPAWSTLHIPIEFSGALYGAASLIYLASLTADGTGGDITNLILTLNQVTASTYDLVVVNPNGSDVFLVNNLSALAGVRGDPRVAIAGQLIRQAIDGGYRAVRYDTPSQNLYGVQSLDVPDNAWRQSTTAADSLADDLLSALKDPHPTLTGVEIVADYRLQLADRVRVADPTGLALDKDFWLVASHPSLSASDVGHSVTLRQA